METLAIKGRSSAGSGKPTVADEVARTAEDHAPALETIPTQAARLGFQTDIEESGASEWRITITRTQAEEEV